MGAGGLAPQNPAAGVPDVGDEPVVGPWPDGTTKAMPVAQQRASGVATRPSHSPSSPTARRRANASDESASKRWEPAAHDPLNDQHQAEPAARMIVATAVVTSSSTRPSRPAKAATVGLRRPAGGPAPSAATRETPQDRSATSALRVVTPLCSPRARRPRPARAAPLDGSSSARPLSKSDSRGRRRPSSRRRCRRERAAIVTRPAGTARTVKTSGGAAGARAWGRKRRRGCRVRRRHGEDPLDDVGRRPESWACYRERQAAQLFDLGGDVGSAASRPSALTSAPPMAETAAEAAVTTVRTTAACYDHLDQGQAAAAGRRPSARCLPAPPARPPIWTTTDAGHRERQR